MEVSQNWLVTIPLSSFKFVFSNNFTDGVDPMPAITKSVSIKELSFSKIS